MDVSDGARHFGKFEISAGKLVDGQLTLDRARTSIHVQDSDYFRGDQVPDRCIKGILLDGTRVSLVDCVPRSLSGSAFNSGTQYHYASYFPHFVIYGAHSIAPSDNIIKSIAVVVDDASSIFDDTDAFGSVIDARPLIKSVVQEREQLIERPIEIGERPRILYFTGKHPIFNIQTAIGEITAYHRIQSNLGGSEGIYITNAIAVSITFDEPAVFDHTIRALVPLLKFLELIAGRPQNLTRLSVEVAGAGEYSSDLQVYWSRPPRRNNENEDRSPQPGDLPLDAIRRPQEFRRVLANWLERHEAWKDARFRFFESFSMQSSYTAGRVVGSANMFDILPHSALPRIKHPLPEDIESAKNQCRQVFLKLACSPERGNILNALGRLDQPTLRTKILHLAEPVIVAFGGQLNELRFVIDAAVKCRNFYVHGGDQQFDYTESFTPLVSFLTNTLEFVFAASDLIQSGWDIASWRGQGTTMSHPFGSYCVNYAQNVMELRTAITAYRQRRLQKETQATSEINE